ncbi:hypothetical protein ACFPRL_17470 [Pseudoclavibacter helvolus]
MLGSEVLQFRGIPRQDLRQPTKSGASGMQIRLTRRVLPPNSPVSGPSGPDRCP